ncbi:MAG: tripartite tricarboxylate transporter substrate binding protein [Betaproteobacteria bacterium]|nr:tripartite tricarboxylate transporter substrate binding protein [Betaproteobacteria bacterium]
MRKTKFVRSGLLSWVVVGLFASEVLAQGYPAKPIRVIDAFPAGGGTDIVARLIAPKFLESQGQSWVVDNRPGAGGIIGTDIVAKSPPDGYTLLMFSGSFTVHPSIYKNLPYDLTKAFAPVTQTSTAAAVLVVHPSVPARTVKELIALAKARPGRLNFASGGSGTTFHVAVELFKSMAGISMTHIPYKGSAPALLATVGGEVDLTLIPMPSGAPYIRSGRLRALAVSTAKRDIAMPELPTIAEAGLSGFEATNPTGVLAPVATPREIVAKLQQEIARIVNMPDIRERLLGLGAEPVGSTPEQFGEYIRTEIAKWAKVVKAAGLELQTF